MRKVRVTVVTAADGTVTAYSPRLSGEIQSVAYIKAGAGGYDDGVDFTITKESTGEGVWTESNVNASTTRYPRAPTHSQVGAALLYAATFAVADKIGVANDRVKIVLAQGGNVKTGAFDILVC
jgi:hypothetical protein